MAADGFITDLKEVPAGRHCAASGVCERSGVSGSDTGAGFF